MPYKEYKPDSTDKVVIDDIEFEVHKYTDGDNVYWCGKCGEMCPDTFYYINDCALCSDKCKDDYLQEVKETQEGSKELSDMLNRQIAHQTKLGGQPVPGPGGTIAIPMGPGALSGKGKKKRAKKNQKVTLGDFVFAVHIYPDIPNTPVVTINTVSHWQSTGYLVDGYTPAEQQVLDPILQKYNLSELMESQFESDGSLTEAQLIANLQKEGLVFDAQFQQFMK
jgi:hypothetical protein